MKIDATGPAQIALGLSEYLNPEQTARAVARGLNKAAIGIRAHMVKRLREDFSVKASVMKAVMPIVRADRRTLASTIRVQGEALPLVEFALPASLQKVRDGDKVLKPVKVRIHKGGPAKEVPHAFYVGKFNAITVRESRGEGSGRGPLKTLYGPSLASQARKIQGEMQDFAREITAKRLEESISFEIKRALGLL